MNRSILIFFGLFFLIAVEAQERYIVTSDSVKLFVKVKGEGTPCLYIHGGPGSGSYWLEKYFGDYLEKHFQMVYLDQRGVSRSSSPADDNYSMNRMLKDFEEVRSELGIHKWLTLGHSFGGILQMSYVEKYPLANAGMIMINTTINLKESIYESWIPKANEILEIEDSSPCTDDIAQIFNKVSEVSGKLKERNLMWKLGYAKQENEIEMDSTFNEIPDWNWDFASRAMSIEDYWKDYSFASSDVEIPVLFFYGKTDWIIGPEYYKSIYFPNMILWGSDVGHMPFMENKPDLEKAIDAFIEKYDF
ncbi:MAG: alpha/beta hydrolase [Dysgonamonadaceae bacterium]|jgi:proline iminopeptidase|nr:alpha/beta hydrolase [Dysgonamonadaceae bacterium]MDD3356665.1 alpha/beta hydrolase [Dysgonamonadaceae bacterium]MDD3728310.1 alpha/beta hydrolase [Dysgonamonadaceae bacterium]MDD4247465.1 alpha/beta hydrolase [Dysgonamonadaceae bacterium]MDD4606193.1 alpha/beta hydrolase [Dysgonamonadaceae bacterium]